MNEQYFLRSSRTCCCTSFRENQTFKRSHYVSNNIYTYILACVFVDAKYYYRSSESPLPVSLLSAIGARRLPSTEYNWGDEDVNEARVHRRIHEVRQIQRLHEWNLGGDFVSLFSSSSHARRSRPTLFLITVT